MIKILQIIGFSPSRYTPKAVIVTDEPGNPLRRFEISAGVTSKWENTFRSDPDAYIGKRAIVATLPPISRRLRYPVFVSAADLDRVDRVMPAAQVDETGKEVPIVAFLGNTELSLEIADTPDKSMMGYMFRTNIPTGTGMLFTKQEPGNFCFWMRNTPTPLDLIFIGEDLRVVEIVPNMQPFSEKLIVNKNPAVFAIEVPAGSVAVNPGDLLSY